MESRAVDPHAKPFKALRAVDERLPERRVCADFYACNDTSP